MRPCEEPDEPPMLGHRERLHVVREHAAGGLRQCMIGTNRDRKARHDLCHCEPLQQVVHLVGGKAGGWRGQHQPQVALAEETDQASALADREMTQALILHQSIRRVHGGLGGDRERRRRHQVPDSYRRGLGLLGVMERVSHRLCPYYIAILLIT